MNSNLFRLDWKDILNGLVVTVLSATLDCVVQLIGVPGFSFYQFNWQMVVTTAVIAGLGYLSKKLLTDQQGKFGGVI